MPKGVYRRTSDMRTGKYARTEAMKVQCRLNASKAGGFHGTHSDETKAVMRARKLANPTRFWAGKKRGPSSAVTKQKQRDAKVRSGFMPSHAARRLAAKALVGGPTSIERKVSAYLDSAGIPHFRQFEIGRYSCDILVPRWNLVIECDGTFWHTGKFSDKKKEQRRDAFISEQGIDVVRLPEKVIRDDERFLVAITELARKGEFDVRSGVQNLQPF